MKKRYTFYFIFACIALFFVNNAISAPVDTNRVKQAACNFFRTVSPNLNRSAEVNIVYTAKADIASSVNGQFDNVHSTGNSRPTETSPTVSCYYVLQFEPEGWAVMSADDRVEPLLAYSTTGRFDTVDAPPARQMLLNGYREEIAYVLRENVQSNEMTSKWESMIAGTYHPQNRLAVAPLISTHWGQSNSNLNDGVAIYNSYCPDDPAGPQGHAVVGCGAVVTAQIINYWRFPSVGIGENGYYSNYHDYNSKFGNYGWLSVNFSQANYNFPMANQLQSNSNLLQSQFDEVARLLYHCGVAMNTKYGPHDSETNTGDVPYALANFFGYSSSGQVINKNDYGINTWENIIRNELNSGRPVPYRGRDTIAPENNDNVGGGHIFICDGYDPYGNFHFNWGWDGNHDNEYFLISSLNPSYYFSHDHQAIIGISAERNYPTVRSLSFSSLLSYGVTIDATVLSKGSSDILERGVCYSTTQHPTINSPHVQYIDNSNGIGAYTCQLTGLDPNTRYYVRAYARNSSGYAYENNDLTFITPCNLVSASIVGSATFNYGSEPINLTAMGSGSYRWSNGATTQSISVSPTTSTSYTVTVTNNYGCTATASHTVSVIIPTSTVTTNAVSNIGMYSVEAGGVVSGNASITYRGVCWSTTNQNPTTSNSYKVCGSGTGSFSCTINNLSPGTTYYLRAYATSNTGTTYYGTSRTFTTSSPNTYTVSVASNNNSLGTARIGTSGNMQSASYSYGQQAVVSATANGNNRFVCWRNGTQFASSEASYSFTVTDNVNLTAFFQASSQYYQVTTSSSPAAGGTTSGGGSFASGSSVTVSAAANSGWHFVRWTENGSQVSTNANYTISSLGADRSLVAVFAQNVQSGNVYASADPNYGGSVTGSGSYAVGSTVTLTATPYSGYQFVNWNQNGNFRSFDNVFSFEMPPGGDVYITASFEPSVSDYYINNLSDLIAFRDGINSGSSFYWYGSYGTPSGTVPAGAAGKTFHLNNEISCSSVNNWTPIGTSSSPFRGTFDGGCDNGNTIRDIFSYQNSSNYIGLFGYISSTAVVKNLWLIESQFTGNNYVGGICGYNEGQILNCRFGSSAAGNYYVGGFCGYNSGTIRGCQSYPGGNYFATGTRYVGGIVGYSADATVTNCNVFALGSTVRVYGSTTGVGGICGYQSGGTLSNCFCAAVQVDGPGIIGGVCGFAGNGASINQCFNVSPILGGQCSGGIVGRLGASSSISHCYNSNKVSGSVVGGICGDINNSNSSIQSCYNIGGIAYTSSGGAICGTNSGGSVNNCFYDKQMCTVSGSYGTGKLTTEMVGSSLQSYLGNNYWRYSSNQYPNLAGFTLNPQSGVSTAAIFLSYSNSSNYETVDDVRSPFTVYADNSRCQWSLYSGSSLNVDNISSGNVGLNSTGETQLQCHTLSFSAGNTDNDCRRVIRLNVTSVRHNITVWASPSNYGTVTGGGSYEQGSSCTLTAIPSTGYHFKEWDLNFLGSGNYLSVSTSNPYTFSVTSDREMVAIFQPNSYTINTSSSPTTGGQTSGGGVFNHGTSVTVTATPAAYHTFARWTRNGSTVSTSASYTFTATEDRDLVAVFTPNNYTVTTNVSPSGGGSVSGGGSYAYGSTATLTASPATGYNFAGWKINNNIVSPNTSYSHVVEGNVTVTAVFEKKNYTLTLSSSNTSAGAVSGGGVYPYGTSVTARAIPATGYHFVKWTRNGSQVSTQQNYTFTLTTNRTLVANFEADPQLPTVTTPTVANITVRTASFDADVTADGGASVTDKGFCWGTSHNPTLNNNVESYGSGIGGMTYYMASGLDMNTTYYVRAYATNSVGTVYSAEVSFITPGVPLGDAQPCPGYATVTDIDGNVYNTVKIGQQCWMKENLRTTHYADGSAIPLGTTASPTIPYRYEPSADVNDLPAYGYLYNWPAAMRGMTSSNTNPSYVQGICPEGWHIPSSAEWTQLADYVRSVPAYWCAEDSDYVAKALCSTTGWQYSSGSNNCSPSVRADYNNLTGFSAMPAGFRMNYILHLVSPVIGSNTITIGD